MKIKKKKESKRKEVKINTQKIRIDNQAQRIECVSV